MSSNGNKKELSMNPQRKRWEQLKKRREHDEMLREQQLAHNSKTKKKMSKEVSGGSSDSKASAEMVDYEYSVEEDFEDDEFKATKNETIRKLLIYSEKLEKSVKLAKENEKKLGTLLESLVLWFDRYERMLDDLDDQVGIYDQKRQTVVDNLIDNVHPLCDRWRSAQKTMASVKISGPLPTAGVFTNLAHYGITVLRQVLFYMAYCRDLIPRRVLITPPTSDSPRTTNSLISLDLK
uniref:AATF-Che1 domain-containing protein n=1 Tax=Caenorhabditis tropicalis TaxID=1561998 RepID=A0A1I7TB48_9PELO